MKSLLGIDIENMNFSLSGGLSVGPIASLLLALLRRQWNIRGTLLASWILLQLSEEINA